MLLTMLVWLHSVRPFTDGGDDWDYYTFVTRLTSLQQAFDAYSYIDAFEQPGYPILLAPFALLSNGNMLSLKAVNLACLIILTAVWSRIGYEIQGKQFGRLVGIFVALLLPLWYYCFFLLKDLPIAMLQGISVLGGVLICKRRMATGLLLISVSTILIIPLRTYLALINIALLGVSLFGMYHAATPEAGYTLMRRVRFFTLSFIISITVAHIILSDQFFTSIGILTESRKLTIENISTLASLHGTNSLIHGPIFPIVYLVSETAGIRVLLMGFDDSSEILRGLFAVPWIIFYLPFLGVGIYLFITRLGLSGALVSPWLPIVSFCIMYMIVSWTVGDTTRWRLSDFPALATVAALGFSQLKSDRRLLVLLVSNLTALCSAAIFYMALQ